MLDRVWDVYKPSTGNETCFVPLIAHSHFVGTLTPLAPTPALPRLFASGGNDKLICVWDKNAIPRDSAATDGTKTPALMLLGHTDTISCLSSTIDGLILSGSWDKTVRIWENGECVAVLEKHQAAVWGVLGLPNGDIVTASADKLILIWRLVEGEKHKYAVYKTLTRHTDCVRGLALVPEIGGFVSCGNDSLIAVWSADGAVLQEFNGHQAFVYAVAVIPGVGYVSASEDRTIRIWTADGESQTLTHPAGVWSVAVSINGDVVSACADGVARIWTKNESRVAPADVRDRYHDAVAAQSIPSDNVGDIKMSELPEIDAALANPGKKDGETKVVRANGKAEAHQWSLAEGRWIKIGEVVDANASGASKALLDGVEYDYVFDIDVNEGAMFKIGFNNGMNPYVVAQEFLWKNDLDQSFLEDIAQFLIKNVSHTTMTIGAPQGSGDPITGAGRYIPGSGDQQPPPTIAPPPVNRPSTSNSNTQYSPVDSNQYVPVGVYTYFDAANSDALLPKLVELNKALASDPATKSLALDEDENEVLVFKSILSILKETSRFHSTSFNDQQYKVLFKLFKWPQDKLLPVLDVLRVMVLHPGASRTFEQMIQMKQFNVLDTLFRLPVDNATNQMLVIKILCNMIRHDHLRQFIFAMTGAAIEKLRPVYQGQSANKTFSTSWATLLLETKTVAEQESEYQSRWRKRDLSPQRDYDPFTGKGENKGQEEVIYIFVFIISVIDKDIKFN
eukprot:gene5625-6489_t